MPPPGYIAITLRKPLIEMVDNFLARSNLGYGSRPEVIAAAIREFIERHQPPDTPSRA